MINLKINSYNSFYNVTQDYIQIGLKGLQETDIDIIIETVIHETMHKAIYKITKDKETTALFDLLDITSKISATNIFKNDKEYYAAIHKAGMYIITPTQAIIQYASCGIISLPVAFKQLQKYK